MATFFRLDAWVKDPLGRAIAGAQAYLCGQPANVPSTITSTSYPSPQQSLYADPEGQTPLSQPVSSDGYGHVYLYAAPGVYTLLIYTSGALQNSYTDQLLG